ncbi:2,3-bisphosphoglycerate-independent phosphoglycerate mutase [Candidatus Saccharibacteria bacterium]|nr:2,3-bisphosphoglycerate-independent phosphoglycerate mutase [Candidatus Saccharibacteria bacterium]
MDKLRYDGPVVLAILDGVGLAPDGPGNAVSRARTSFLGSAAREYLHVALNASGEAVGLTPDQMGNSEVGHTTMGSGQILKHGISLINAAFDKGEVFNSDAWRSAVTKGLNGGVLHFAGIFSDGGVHSHMAHLEQMITRAYNEGVREMRVHAIFDGRDVSPFSSTIFIQRFENFVRKFPDANIKIASGGGRMVCVADRYENDWGIVKKGFDMMVKGEAEYYFRTPEEAIQILRRINPEVQDQNLQPFVIVDDMDQPIGRVKKGDAFIYFDFRADRAIEIAQAFTYWDFPYFDRGDYQPSDVYFVGMTEYNSDTHVPEHRLVQPVQVRETLNKFLETRGVSQLAVSETVKFGHVTYYFNGCSYEKARGEEFIEIESDIRPFETRPWMKSAEITDAVIDNISKYKFIRLNFPGGDMVGHTADVNATMMAMEAIDLSLERIANEVDKLGGVLVVVADHGNAEELTDEDGNKKTAHTTNQIPFIIYDNTKNAKEYELSGVVNPGLSNVAATIATLLGYNEHPSSWGKSLIKVL